MYPDFCRDSHDNFPSMKLCVCLFTRSVVEFPDGHEGFYHFIRYCGAGLKVFICSVRVCCVVTCVICTYVLDMLQVHIKAHKILIYMLHIYVKTHKTDGDSWQLLAAR